MQRTDGIPREVALIQTLVNTLDLEERKDALATAAGLAAFAREHDLPGAARPSAADAERVRSVREALRRVLYANNGGPSDPEAVRILREAGDACRLRVGFDDAGLARVEPAGAGVEATIGALLAAVERIQAEGHWQRFKACAAHDCHWAYYDQSRNRSRTWCSMEVCGNRAKARTFRARTS